MEKYRIIIVSLIDIIKILFDILLIPNVIRLKNLKKNKIK